MRDLQRRLVLTWRSAILSEAARADSWCRWELDKQITRKLNWLIQEVNYLTRLERLPSNTGHDITSSFFLEEHHQGLRNRKLTTVRRWRKGILRISQGLFTRPSENYPDRSMVAALDHSREFECVVERFEEIRSDQWVGWLKTTTGRREGSIGRWTVQYWDRISRYHDQLSRYQDLLSRYQDRLSRYQVREHIGWSRLRIWSKIEGDQRAIKVIDDQGDRRSIRSGPHMRTSVQRNTEDRWRHTLVYRQAQW